MSEYHGSLKRRLVSGTAWSVVGRTVAVLASVITTAVLSRLLTPGTLGVYFLIVSLVSVVGTISLLGLGGVGGATVSLVATEKVRSSDAAAKQLSASILHIGSLGIVVVSIVLFAGMGHWLATRVLRAPLIADHLGYIILWISLSSLGNLLAEIFRAFHNIRYAIAFGGVTFNVLSALMLTLLWFFFPAPTDIKYVLLVTNASAAVNVFVAAVLFGKTLKNSVAFIGKGYSEILRVSGPLFIFSLAIIVMTQADLWILGRFRPHEEVALYGAAARLVMFVLTPLVILHSVIPPIVAEMHALGKREELEKVLRTISAIAGIPAFIVLGCLIAGSGLVLNLVYGDFYVAGSTLLIILALGNVTLLSSGTAVITLTTTGHQLTLLVITLATMSGMVLADLAVVSSYGALGVACVTATGTFLYYLGIILVVRIKVGVWTYMGAIRLRHIRETFSMIASRIGM